MKNYTKTDEEKNETSEDDCGVMTAEESGLGGN